MLLFLAAVIFNAATYDWSLAGVLFLLTGLYIYIYRFLEDQYIRPIFYTVINPNLFPRFIYCVRWMFFITLFIPRSHRLGRVGMGGCPVRASSFSAPTSGLSSCAISRISEYSKIAPLQNHKAKKPIYTRCYIWSLPVLHFIGVYILNPICICCR